MYNLNLLKTLINELNQNTFIIKELIQRAIDKFKQKKEQIMVFFSNNTSLTHEDLKKKSDKSYALESTYLVICYQNIAQSLEKLCYKFSAISFTENIHTNLKPEELKQVESNYYALVDNIVTRHIFQTKEAKSIALKLHNLKNHKHSESDGSTINNLYNKSAISVYIKNRKQFIHKLARTTKDNFSSLIKAIESSNLIKFDESTLRIELTLFSYIKILQKKYVDIFEQIKQYFNLQPS